MASLETARDTWTPLKIAKFTAPIEQAGKQGAVLMRQTIAILARRARSLLQRAPIVGTAIGGISLDDPGCGDTVASCFTFAKSEKVVSRFPLANPAEVDYESPEKRVRVLRDILFWPAWGVAVDARSRLLLESAFSAPRLAHMIRGGVFRCFPFINCDVPATTIQVGPSWDNHYHWLIDSLPRLWALHDPRVAELGTIHLFVCGDLNADRERLLRALLPPYVEVVSVSSHSRIRAKTFVLLPFLAQDNAGYLPAGYLDFFRDRAFKAFGIHPAKTGTKRVLVSRSMASTRRLTNQSELEERLRPLGFTPVGLESLSFADQMALFADAESVVASHGAGLTNLLFSESCKVLELFTGRSLTHYRLLSQAMGHQYANLLGDNPTKNANAPAPLDAIVERLRKLGVQ